MFYQGDITDTDTTDNGSTNEHREPTTDHAEPTRHTRTHTHEKLQAVGEKLMAGNLPLGLQEMQAEIVGNKKALQR